MSRKKFVLNDENVTNSYGFRVLTAGINLDRFRSNPVILNNHSNHTKDVLGMWDEITSEGKLLTAESEFDTEDPDGKEVVRKVQKGLLKAASIGIRIEPENLKNINGDLVVTQCELMEASIVAVPSNANAIVLYASDDRMMTEQEIKSLCLDVQTINPFENHTKMKIVLSHLQLAETATETEILEAVKTIEAKLTASETEKNNLQAKLTAFENAEKERQTTLLNAEIETAIKDGRIDAGSKEHFKNLEAETSLEILKNLPKRTPVTEQIENEGGASEKYAKLSWEELRKQNKLEALKADNYELYEQKFEEKFGTKPSKK